jgi:hypothetical protein
MAAKTFTADELETLYSIFDTVIPGVSVEDLHKLNPHLKDDVDAETVAAFAAEVPSQNAQYRDCVENFLPRHINDGKFAELKQVLSLLRYVPSGYIRPLADSLQLARRHARPDTEHCPVPPAHSGTA